MYIQTNRKYIHLTGSIIENTWTQLPNHVSEYLLANNTRGAYITLYKDSHEEWWAYVKRPNDSVIIEWYLTEEIYAKGPTGGWHTTKQATFAGKRKQ